ncbi:DUF6465 family protein [Pseudobutyrivibrio xylanivorans]|uniref:Uncharacterized protein n=1 Tax=Pseudobutyrivibrio xylanivorans TaxID=185007 RepID=A0A1G5S0Q4_PSEXY|nr:DUF6465 family protein [Pseudobutyrivibrio xylanivorans]SCZ79520.1 hypothetical protein SAMN02910350_01815 [Pseudobutyrivibrio xylanivorans]
MAVKKTSTTKKTAGHKKAVKSSAVVQYGNIEFSEEACLKKAQSGFKKQFKGQELESINIYIKPEESKIYFVANTDCVGSVDL